MFYVCSSAIAGSSASVSAPSSSPLLMTHGRKLGTQGYFVITAAQSSVSMIQFTAVNAVKPLINYSTVLSVDNIGTMCCISTALIGSQLSSACESLAQRAEIVDNKLVFSDGTYL